MYSTSDEVYKEEGQGPLIYFVGIFNRENSCYDIIVLGSRRGD